MQKPSERHKLTSDNNIIKSKKPVHDPFNSDWMAYGRNHCNLKINLTDQSDYRTGTNCFIINSLY